MSKNFNISPIIFIIFTVVIYFVINKIFDKENFKICNNSNNTNNSNNYILKIYQMLFDIDKIFNKHKINYFIDSGTLLGAVRHKGIIPWDDDADICIFDNQETQLINLKPILNEYGYDITKFWGGYKIFYINGEKIKIENSNWSWNNSQMNKEKENIKYRFPFCDITIVKYQDNKIVYKDDKVRRIWKKCFYHKKDLFPLKKYKFGIFNLQGPNKPTNFLDNCYGKDWNKIKKDNYDHLNQRFKYGKNIMMDKSDYLPALPVHPIINKFN